MASPQELAGLAPGASPRCIGRSRPLCIATVHRPQSQFVSPAIRPPLRRVENRCSISYLHKDINSFYVPPLLSGT